MSAIDYEARAGLPQPWWNEMVTLMIARPEASTSELAKALDKSVSGVFVVKKSQQFQAMLADAQRSATKLPQALEAIAAYEQGTPDPLGKPGDKTVIRFRYSRGQIENKMRELIMDAANETVPILDKDGKETGRQPALSAKERWDLANKTIAALKQPKTTIIGKQANTLHVTTPAAGHALSEDLPAAIQEMLTLLDNSISTKRVERADGSVEFVAQVRDVTPKKASPEEETEEE